MKRSILFLSDVDFRKRSAQVIRKTPKAFVDAGWEVTYVVFRSNDENGSYFYEDLDDPVGVKVHRLRDPLENLKGRVRNRLLKAAILKVSSYLIVLKLAQVGRQIMNRQKIDVIYGFEVRGILAMHLLKLFPQAKDIPTVTRFLGTIYYQYVKNKRWVNVLFHADQALALFLRSDLSIMTNDGTEGDKALRFVRSRNLRSFRFWVNGVDEQKLSDRESQNLRQSLGVPQSTTVFLTVCRLVDWKRVDRGIKAFAELHRRYESVDAICYIVGEGAERRRLEDEARVLGVADKIRFVGAIDNVRIKEFLAVADFVVLTYDYSNVGNPLLEAIRANKVIFTLNNGDTGSWITHEENGFLYEVNDDLAQKMAEDMHRVMIDDSLKRRIVENVTRTEAERLWTWRERLDMEVQEVTALVEGSPNAAGLYPPNNASEREYAGAHESRSARRL